MNPASEMFLAMEAERVIQASEARLAMFQKKQEELAARRGARRNKYADEMIRLADLRFRTLSAKVTAQANTEAMRRV